MLLSLLVCQNAQSLWFFNSPDKAKITVNERIKKYIGHLVDTLFDVPQQSHSTKNKLEELKRVLTSIILHSNVINYENDSFNADLVEQMVLAEALIFIQGQAYLTAFEITNLLDGPCKKIDQKKMITTIAENIGQQAQDHVFKASDLNGIFAHFVGTHLKNNVHALLKEYIAEAASSSIPAHIYDLDEPSCNTCFEDFDKYTYKRIIFACGHSLCKACTLIIGKSNQRCPICRRQTVNLSLVSDQLS